MNIQQIKEAIESAPFWANYFGLRMSHTPVEVGSELDNSFDWDYENDVSSDEELNGTCAIAIDKFAEDEEIQEALNMIAQYDGQLCLIAGTSQEFGADQNEVIIQSAEVILL